MWIIALQDTHRRESGLPNNRDWQAKRLLDDCTYADEI